MKSFLFQAILLVQHVSAAAGPHLVARSKGNIHLGGGGKVEPGPNDAPARTELPTTNKTPGAKRVKIRSGPYKVPDMTVVSTPYGDKGALFNYPDTKIRRPCEGECTIIWQQAGLEYPNGTNANVDTGLWLHHMVGFIRGPKRWDPTGYSSLACFPFYGVGDTPGKAERYFASGNERAEMNWNYKTNATEGSGIHLTKDDSFQYLVDLMNMNMEAKQVYVTMTYDYVEGALPAKWLDVKTVWLDAFQCGTSEVAPPQQTGAFTIQSKPWAPTFEGKILGSLGHVHDGGIFTETNAGPGKILCLSKVNYAEKPEFKFTGQMTGDDKPAVNHISSMTDCPTQGVTELKKGAGQMLQVIGKYNYDEAPGNLEGGKQSNIMAISLIVVGIPGGGIPLPK